MQSNYIIWLQQVQNECGLFAAYANLSCIWLTCHNKSLWKPFNPSWDCFQQLQMFNFADNLDLAALHGQHIQIFASM